MQTRSGNTFLTLHTEGTLLPADQLQRDEQLLKAHQRVCKASKVRNVRHRVEAQLPPDILGIYIYLPPTH